MDSNNTPYICHLFICTNKRDNRKACDNDDINSMIRAKLKKEIETRAWTGKVRISGSMCLGRCAVGPNVMIYPQEKFFSSVTLEDTKKIITEIEEIILENKNGTL